MKVIDKIEGAKEKKIFLGEEGKYTYIEKQYKTDNGEVYSHYIIKYRDTPIVVFQVPKPFGRYHPFGTDAFLAYQHSVRGLMSEIFEVLTGNKKDVSKEYKKERYRGLEYKLTENIAALFLKGIDYQIGAIRLGDKTTNKMLAQNFIDAFEKGEYTYDWTEIQMIE